MWNKNKILYTLIKKKNFCTKLEISGIGFLKKLLDTMLSHHNNLFKMNHIFSKNLLQNILRTPKLWFVDPEGSEDLSLRTEAV